MHALLVVRLHLLSAAVAAADAAAALAAALAARAAVVTAAGAAAAVAPSRAAVSAITAAAMGTVRPLQPVCELGIGKPPARWRLLRLLLGTGDGAARRRPRHGRGHLRTNHARVRDAGGSRHPPAVL